VTVAFSHSKKLKHRGASDKQQFISPQKNFFGMKKWLLVARSLVF
jgi:hypothetical protein